MKNRVLRVLRSREEVNEVLTEFHNELNHLDFKKCMRLLNERVYWESMRADAARWIENCDGCSASGPRKKKPRLDPKAEPEPTAHTAP